MRSKKKWTNMATWSCSRWAIIAVQESYRGLTVQMFDNIDLGKTHEYFKWVAKTFAGPGRKKERPRFVMCVSDLASVYPELTVYRKADDDVRETV
jgi:hypothetical protein